MNKCPLKHKDSWDLEHRVSTFRISHQLSQAAGLSSAHLRHTKQHGVDGNRGAQPPQLSELPVAPKESGKALSSVLKSQHAFSAKNQRCIRQAYLRLRLC